ncbi:MAG: hypothetical protein ACLTC4_02730 [Hungatella hathewayi]
MTPVNTLKGIIPNTGTWSPAKPGIFSRNGESGFGRFNRLPGYPSAAGTITGFERLTLYLAPAYLDTAGRTILVDVSSGTARYEIRARIEPLPARP